MKKLLCLVFLFLSYFLNSQQDTVIFSHKSGVYNSPIKLVLSSTTESKIYYSIGGNTPKTLYKEPIKLTTSTSIRVKIDKQNNSQQTRNYLFPGRKITLPIVCLNINPSDLYDSISGIYVKGPNAKKTPPYFGANFHKGWEKPGYIELIDTSGKIEFNQKIGLKIFGQFSAMLPQKSFAIYARKKYGNKKVKAKIFTSLPYKKYKSFILRNSGSDYCNSHFRDAMMTSLVKNFNIEVQDYRSCVVFLNGNYWGIYHIREKINEHYIKQHKGLAKDSISILKYRGHVQHNKRMNYKQMLKFISKTDFSNQSSIDSLSKLMDIDNYLDYNIAQVYFNNIDAGGNIRFWRPIENGGKWRWILFDTDFGFGLRKGNEQDENTVEDYLKKSNRKWPYPAWSSQIIRNLLENDSIKEIYLKKFTEHLNHTFNSSNVTNHIDKFVVMLSPEINNHFKRWKRSDNIWKKQVDKLNLFANERPKYLFEFLKESFEKDTTFSVSIGKVKNGSLFLNNTKVDSGFNGTFFSQTQYKVVVKPEIGYSFCYWKHDTTLTKGVLNVSFTSNLLLEPVFIKNKKSKYFKKIYINEICYKDSLLSDYIELYNPFDKSINISGWILTGEENKVYVFPKNTVLKPKSFITVFRKKNNTNPNEFHGLFDIEKNKEIKLYSEKQELVDRIKKKELKFEDSRIVEKVNTIIEEGWNKANQASINKINAAQLKSEIKNKYMIIGFFIFIGILFLTALIFVLKKKRPRGATE